MASIEQRLAKLEQAERGSADVPRGIPSDAMNEIRRVASVCATPDDLIIYLKTIEQSDDASLVSLDEKRQGDAARAAFARSVFEEAHQVRSERA